MFLHRVVANAVYVDVLIFVSRFVTEGEVVVRRWCDVIILSKLILGDEYVYWWVVLRRWLSSSITLRWCFSQALLKGGYQSLWLFLAEEVLAYEFFVSSSALRRFLRRWILQRCSSWSIRGSIRSFWTIFLAWVLSWGGNWRIVMRRLGDHLWEVCVSLVCAVVYIVTSCDFVWEAAFRLYFLIWAISCSSWRETVT